MKRVHVPLVRKPCLRHEWFEIRQTRLLIRPAPIPASKPGADKGADKGADEVDVDGAFREIEQVGVEQRPDVCGTTTVLNHASCFNSSNEYVSDRSE